MLSPNKNMFQNNLVSLSDGAISPIELTTNVLLTNPPPLFNKRNAKKMLPSLLGPDGIDALIQSLTSSKNKKKLLKALNISQDDSSIKKAIKKGKKHSHRSHRHVSSVSIRDIKKKGLKKKKVIASKPRASSRIQRKLNKKKKANSSRPRSSSRTQRRIIRRSARRSYRRRT